MTKRLLRSGGGPWFLGYLVSWLLGLLVAWSLGSGGSCGGCTVGRCWFVGSLSLHIDVWNVHPAVQEGADVDTETCTSLAAEVGLVIVCSAFSDSELECWY